MCVYLISPPRQLGMKGSNFQNLMGLKFSEFDRVVIRKFGEMRYKLWCNLQLKVFYRVKVLSCDHRVSLK